MRPSSIDKVFLRRLLLSTAAVLILALAWFGPADRLAQGHVESGLKRAMITFATARTVNALISVVQETTVAIQPMGVGVTLSPAQILDPVNDLVEQFSTLMLLACISFAIQRVLISIGGYEWVSVVLTVSLLAWTWSAWRAGTAPRWLTKMLLVLLLVRFAVPIAALGSEGAFRLTMSSEYEIAQLAVRTTSDDLRLMSPENPVTGTTTGIEKLKEWWDRKKQDVQTRFEQLRDSAEKLVWHVIALMAIFIVQTLILPLLFLWVVQRLFRSALAWSTPLSRVAT